MSTESESWPADTAGNCNFAARRSDDFRRRNSARSERLAGLCPAPEVGRSISGARAVPFQKRYYESVEIYAGARHLLERHADELAGMASFHLGGSDAALEWIHV